MFKYVMAVIQHNVLLCHAVQLVMQYRCENNLQSINCSDITSHYTTSHHTLYVPSVIANEELERFPEMVLGKITKILKIPIPDSREEMAQLLGNFSKIRVNSQESSREHHKERSSISVKAYKPGACYSQCVRLHVLSSAHGHT
jgi:hypothetical protein